MRLPNRPESTAALLLAAIAVLHAFIGIATGRPHGATASAAVARALPAAGSSARKSLEWCLQNVSMVHDVYWASACASEAEARRARRAACAACDDDDSDAPDDSPDCTLPNARAGVLNAARARAEQQCLDEAAAASGGARR